MATQDPEPASGAGAGRGSQLTPFPPGLSEGDEGKRARPGSVQRGNPRWYSKLQFELSALGTWEAD